MTFPKLPIQTADPFFEPEDQLYIGEQVPKILNGQLSMGSNVAGFETEFSEMCQSKWAIAVNACTSALEIGLAFLQLKHTDEVIVPAQTFVATAMAVHLSGATPVFADIDQGTMALSLDAIKKKVSQKTRAIILVHFAGILSSEIDAIVKFCRENNIFLIEDCAHAVGALWNSRRAGTLGDVGCFSFYPTKIMTAGEGGMLVTNSDEISQFARSMQHRGRDFSQKKELYLHPGRNIRMPEFSALLGRVQLKRLPKNLERRREIAAQYAEAFSTISSILNPKIASGSEPAYWKYPILLASDINRDQVLDFLHDKQVMADKSYDPPIHRHPFFLQKYPLEAGALSQTEAILSRHICLPCHNRMSEVEVKYVIRTVVDAIRNQPVV